MSNNDFRAQLIKIYKGGLITRYHHTECDGAHIIPQSICYKFPLLELLSDPSNGLLLSKSLHSTFDQFLWAFDVHAVRDVEGEGPSIEKLREKWCEVPIVVKPNRHNRMINQYAGQYFRVPIQSLAYLWVDYQMFLISNFKGYKSQTGGLGLPTLEDYRELLSSDAYLKIKADPTVLVRPEEFSRQPLVLIKKRNYGGEYLAILDGYSWDQAVWIEEECLDSKLIQSYEQHQYQQSDPTCTRRSLNQF